MLPVYYQTLKQTDKARLDKVQYRAGLLVSAALYYTSRDKLNVELGWESLSDRADFLGLSIFHKIHLGEIRPLIKKCMPTLQINNSRSKFDYKPFKS